MTPEVEKLVHAAARIAVVPIPAEAPDDAYLVDRILVGEIRRLREATQEVLSADARERGIIETDRTVPPVEPTADDPSTH